MLNLRKIALLVLIQACTLLCFGQDSAKFDIKINQLNFLINEEISKNSIPSIAVGIVKDGRVLFADGFGYADIENKISATENTIYQLGSVTKVFTGHLLAEFISKNFISLTDPVESFFPSSIKFPTSSNGQPVTLKEIATHTSEFPRYPENLRRVDPNPIKGYSKDEMLKGIELVNINTATGTRYNYSNFGYGILGVAMENHLKKNLANLMEEYIFHPLNMSQSSLLLNSTLEEQLAIPYLDNSPFTRTEPWEMETLSGAGNLFSSVSDLNKFMIALLDTGNVNEIQQTKYFKINDKWSYGLGCFIVDSQKYDTQVIYHGGDIDGYASSLTLYPEFNLGIVILTNLGEGQVIGEVFSKIDDFVATNFLLKTE